MNVKVNPTMQPNRDGIIDLDLSVTAKKRFRIDKDDNRILELNTSDMTTLSRISETYPKLQALQEEASKIMDGIDIDDTDESNAVVQAGVMGERLSEIDTKMREYLDYIFNSNVSEITAPDGSMYDVFKGSFRYEHIMNILVAQYESNFQSEYKQIEKRVKQMKKHTDKYTTKR